MKDSWQRAKTPTVCMVLYLSECAVHNQCSCFQLKAVQFSTVANFHQFFLGATLFGKQRGRGFMISIDFPPKSWSEGPCRDCDARICPPYFPHPSRQYLFAFAIVLPKKRRKLYWDLDSRNMSSPHFGTFYCLWYRSWTPEGFMRDLHWFAKTWLKTATDLCD